VTCRSLFATTLWARFLVDCYCRRVRILVTSISSLLPFMSARARMIVTNVVTEVKAEVTCRQFVPTRILALKVVAKSDLALHAVFYNLYEMFQCLHNFLRHFLLSRQEFSHGVKWYELSTGTNSRHFSFYFRDHICNNHARSRAHKG
jgi:hypothetical protein